MRLAADKVIDKAKAMAGHLLEASAADIEFEAGELMVAGTDRKMTIQQIAAMSFRPMFPAELGIGLSGTGEFLLQGFTFPNGCQVVEVEIDPETGETDVVNLVSVDDVGTVINPVLLDGQMVGGIVQGLGQALMEVYKLENGYTSTHGFAKYILPTSLDVPDVTSIIVEDPDPKSPLGAKGIGEPALVPTAPAIMNAIYDAIGVRITSLPATPEKILAALQAKRAEEEAGCRAAE